MTTRSLSTRRATRRDFLRLLAAAGGATTALAALGGARAAGAAPRSDAGSTASRRAAMPYGLQLYTLRQAMERDMDGTLAAVAAMGYPEVEFAGYFGRTPAQVKALLAQHNLRAPSTHIPYDMLGARWQQTVDAAATIGHAWVTIPYLPAEVRKNADDWKRVAAQLTTAGAVAQKAGLRVAYHNHDMELAVLPDGASTAAPNAAPGAAPNAAPNGPDANTPLALLLAGTDPALVDFEMDVYWVTKAGADPIAWLNAHPNRFRMLHLKDAGPAPARRMAPVGSGTIDWPRVLAAGARAGVRHGFVEHDDAADPLASARSSHDYLARLAPVPVGTR